MSRVRLAVELTLIGPVLTHGSGAGRLGVDATVATLPDGRCYLPFSLIKGRLRQSWDELDFAEAEEWFGSRVGGWSATRGRFRFTDLIETRAAKRVGMPTRHRICIDEETGAADDGMLQVLENPFAAGERVVFKGEITFFGSDANAETIREQLLSAFQWTSGFGAGRTIGFGRVHEAQVSIVSEGKEQIPGTLQGSDFDYAITLRDPFCLARRRIAENLFETDEVIPGAAIRGVAATTLNDLLGRRSSEIIDGHAVIDPQWSALARHFNTITISHAFPSNDARPVEPPISLVKYSDEKLVDIALQNGPGLIDGQAPEFFIDWKGDTHGNLRKRYLWPDLGAQKEIRVRTAIDRGTRRAKEKHLFSYEMIRPGETVWRGSVSFAKVPAEERLAVIAQFQKLFALEPAAWGKSKARGRLTLIRTAQPPEAARFAETPWVVTLQTPALLCDPATLNEASGRDELFDAYAAAWADLSDHSLRLVRFFAQQSLAGGYLIHRFRPGRQYAPFLLTNPGSVFVLEPVKPEGQASIETFARERLPLPQWAKDRYTEHWQSNPFLPADGFGEVVVNLPCHREPVPGFTPIETETWEQVATAPTEEIAARVAAANRGSVAPRKEDTSIGKNDPAKFSKRWKISATLRTTSDLHIGTGERLTNRLARIDREKKSQKVEVSAVATDHRNRAYLPGSGLKGALRSWLLEQFPDEVTTIKGVFGAGGDATTSRGGKVEVHDAHASEEQPDAFAPVPHWEVARLTGVTASAAIDRRTRTARDEKLFHREYVPVGITFEVSLSGDELDEVEVALLVRALQGFNDASPIQLGAETREGWGRFQCDAIEVQSTDVALWLDKKPWTSSTEAIRTLASRRTPDALGNQLHIPLTIAFTGPFLVNEPSRTKRPGEENDLPNHAERVGVDEKVVLPVSSFRGALRSRAEKIVRTLGKKACAATDPGDACKAIESAKEVATLCLTCQLFGAPGWATPIDYEGFRLTHEPDPYKQELVAIDRFTGGVSGTAKFNVKAVWRPEFESAMTVNLSRWSTAKMSAETRDAALGLLLLTLRDLADGDMTLGFGASKGYGACTATIEWPPDRAQWIASFSSQFEPRLDSPASVPPVTHLDQQPTLGVAPKPPSTSSPEFHNPYQFVPVSSKRGHHAKVNDSPANVGHDRYVPGTFSGRLRCRLRTLTPVVIGAEQTGPKTESKKVEPFRDPDTGKPAIPASSLRGLISSIAEAASNSSLRVLENKEYEVRVDRKQRRVNGTAHDFFARVSKELLPFNGDRETVTIAEEIFGYVDASGAPTAKALAGRVRFSMARLARDGGDRNLLLPAVPLRILSSPKPPSPAMYFNPSTGDGYVSKQELSVESHRPKGRKFYLHNPESWSGDPWKTNSPAVNPDQKVIVTPVAKGVSFFFDIDFDNLSEVELGLICYALRTSSTFMHKIGMGKSLGLGSVEIDPVALLLTDRQRRYRSSESSRFDSCDLHDSRPTMWPSSNDLEEARGIPPAEVCLAHFRASFRSGMQEGIRDALEAIGDPHLLRRPVHLPQRTGLDLEEETFKWFVKNDSDGVKHQYLRTVVKTIPVLSGVFERRQSAADGPGTARRPGPTPPTPPPPPPAPNEAIAQWIDASLSYDEERQKIMIVAPGQKRVIADANDPRCKEIALAIKEQGSLIRTVTVRAIDQRRYELIEIHSQ